MPRKSELTPEKTLAFQQRIYGAPETFQAGYPGLPSWAIILQSLRDAARALALVGVQALRDGARALALVWRPGSAGRREGVGVGRHPGSAGRRECVGVGMASLRLHAGDPTDSANGADWMGHGMG